MRIPEAEVAYRKVGSEYGYKSSHYVGDEAELEHLFKLEEHCHKVEVRRYIAKLEGQALNGDAHKVKGIVMEEQHQNQKHTKKITVVAAAEAEYVIKGEGYDEKNADPGEMIAAEGSGNLEAVAEKRLRKIYGNGHSKKRQDAEKKIFYLFPILDVEIVLILYLKKQGDHYRQHKLQDKVSVSEGGEHMDSVSIGGKEVFHKIVEEYS